jgi:hypothetical protein
MKKAIYILFLFSYFGTVDNLFSQRLWPNVTERENHYDSIKKRTKYYVDANPDTLFYEGKIYFFRQTPLSLKEKYSSIYSDIKGVITYIHLPVFAIVGNKGYKLTWIIRNDSLFIKNIYPDYFYTHIVKDNKFQLNEDGSPQEEPIYGYISADTIMLRMEKFTGNKFRKDLLYVDWINGDFGVIDSYFGPLPFGNVTDIPCKNWREEIKKIQPDIIYALLNVRAIPLAHEVLMSGLNIPFVWHFKEGPSLSRQVGFWKKLIDLYSYSDGQIYIDPESKIWYEQFTSSDAQMPFILDGDLPKIDYFTDDFSPRISDTDGEIHTVAPGRVIGISSDELQELAKQRIHLHLYIQNYPSTRESFVSMASAVMGDCFHIHSPCIPQDWVKEFSQYDAGWLHCFESRNEGCLTMVEWDDLNLPARMSTLAAAGLPMLQRNNQNHIVAMQSKVEELNAGICFDSYGQLGALLKNKELMQTLRKNVFMHRYKFSFDYHVPALIGFFRQIIDRKRKK